MGIVRARAITVAAPLATPSLYVPLPTTRAAVGAPAAVENFDFEALLFVKPLLLRDKKARVFHLRLPIENERHRRLVCPGAGQGDEPEGKNDPFHGDLLLTTHRFNGAAPSAQGGFLEAIHEQKQARAHTTQGEQRGEHQVRGEF